MAGMRSQQAWVMFNPEAGYRYLAGQPGLGGTRLAAKRPLFVAFLLGCAVSLITSGTLTLRLVLPSMIYWGLLPLIQAAALTAVCWSERRRVSIPRTIDSFFAGYGPWSLWLIGISAIWSFLSPLNRSIESTLSTTWFFGGAGAVIIWSAYLDFCFFRFVLDKSRKDALRNLLVQRLISWSVIVFILGAPAAWEETVGRYLL